MYLLHGTATWISRPHVGEQVHSPEGQRAARRMEHERIPQYRECKSHTPHPDRGQVAAKT